MGKKKLELKSEDKELFLDAVKDVKPMQQDKTIPPPLNRKIIVNRRIISYPSDDFRFTGQIILEKLSDDDWLTPEHSIHFIRGEIPLSTRKKLKTGQVLIDAKLDLHGYTGDEAINALTVCLSHNHAHGRRVLLIIHGKGRVAGQQGPILKNIVYQWLKNQHDVLAIQSAHPKHGGTGAVYVLLRRQKKES